MNEIQQKKQALFADVIQRFETQIGSNLELANRAYSKSVKIAGTERPFEDCEKLINQSADVIGTLHSLIDGIERNNLILRAVVEDLENSIM